MNLNEPRMVYATVEVYEDRISGKIGHIVRVNEVYNVPLIAVTSIINSTMDSIETLDTAQIKNLVTTMLHSFNIHRVDINVKVGEPREMKEC